MKILVFFICTASLRLVSNDLFFPSLPEMQTTFEVGKDIIQFGSFMNLLGAFLSGFITIIYADFFSKSKILIISLLVFFSGSLTCALSDSINILNFGRFAQGIGCSSLVICGYAAVQSQYQGKEASDLYANASFSIGIFTILAPLFGGIINARYGWRYNFYFLVILSSILLLILPKLLGRCNSFCSFPNKKIKTFDGISLILKDRHFLLYSSYNPIIFCCYWMYSVSSPFYFSTHLEISSEVFGTTAALSSTAFMIGSLLSKFVSKIKGLNKCIFIGLLLCTLAAIVLFLSQIFSLHYLSLLLTFQVLYMAGCGLVSGPSIACSLSRFTSYKITTSAIRTTIYNLFVMTGVLVSCFLKETTLLYISYLLASAMGVLLMLFYTANMSNQAVINE